MILWIEVIAVFMTRIQWSYLMDRERVKNDHFYLFFILTKKEKNIYYSLIWDTASEATLLNTSFIWITSNDRSFLLSQKIDLSQKSELCTTKVKFDNLFNITILSHLLHIPINLTLNAISTHWPASAISC